ncbi:hypothetical protein AX774_g967 [Zancudomyces culisetae]|uniref:Uncharacterized protein n=1 Tax=Zancudomyces culisetae TaxID=1213189 RepID=A0A1R1PX28_ZANCU|nr:hypothetical protein AX774_g967 [Zancudomyces culisetae]|eukprot:OMH85477.1 hypothetical protein AX774_g967 [Zancudomyces culisetae]
MQELYYGYNKDGKDIKNVTKGVCTSPQSSKSANKDDRSANQSIRDKLQLFSKISKKSGRKCKKVNRIKEMEVKVRAKTIPVLKIQEYIRNFKRQISPENSMATRVKRDLLLVTNLKNKIELDYQVILPRSVSGDSFEISTIFIAEEPNILLVGTSSGILLQMNINTLSKQLDKEKMNNTHISIPDGEYSLGSTSGKVCEIKQLTANLYIYCTLGNADAGGRLFLGVFGADTYRLVHEVDKRSVFSIDYYPVPEKAKSFYLQNRISKGFVLIGANRSVQLLELKVLEIYDGYGVFKDFYVANIEVLFNIKTESDVLSTVVLSSECTKPAGSSVVVCICGLRNGRLLKIEYDTTSKSKNVQNMFKSIQWPNNDMLNHLPTNSSLAKLYVDKVAGNSTETSILLCYSNGSVYRLSINKRYNPTCMVRILSDNNAENHVNGEFSLFTLMNSKYLCRVSNEGVLRVYSMREASYLQLKHNLALDMGDAMFSTYNRTNLTFISLGFGANLSYYFGLLMTCGTRIFILLPEL